MAAVSNLIHAGVSPQGHIVLSFIYNKHASLFELQILYSAAELWARLTANTQTGKHLSVVISIQGVHFSPICPFLSTVVRIAWPWETHNNNERLPIASREHQIHLYPLDELTLFFHPDFFFSGLQILTCQTIETPALKVSLSRQRTTNTSEQILKQQNGAVRARSLLIIRMWPVVANDLPCPQRKWI